MGRGCRWGLTSRVPISLSLGFGPHYTVKYLWWWVCYTACTNEYVLPYHLSQYPLTNLDKWSKGALLRDTSLTPGSHSHTTETSTHAHPSTKWTLNDIRHKAIFKPLKGVTHANLTLKGVTCTKLFTPLWHNTPP